MYLVYGESFRLIEDEIKKIIGAETNVTILDLANITLEDVLQEANYVSMFQEKKYILVKNANFFASGKATEKETDLLLQYMDSPSQLSVVIFTTFEKIDLRKKITKSFKEKYKIISVMDLSYDDLVIKCLDYVKKNKYKISTKDLQYIMNCCHNKYDLIYNELNKLFLYYQEPTEILMEDITKIVSKSVEDNNFKFVDAVVDKRFHNAITILEDLYTLKVDPISLLLLLAREYRLMYSVSTLMREGYRKRSVCQELGLQEWQVDKLLRESSKYDQDELAMYLKKLAQFDFQIKSGTMDRFLAMKTFLLTIE